jgi:acyl dehydratase
MSQTTIGRPDAQTRDVAAHMHSLVGEHFRMPDFYEVGREKIREFATAIQDAHPAHHTEAGAAALGHDTIIASPTFVSVLGGIALENLFEHVIGDYDPGSLLQIDQGFKIHNQIRVGDRLTSDLYLESFRQLAGSDIIVIKNDITDENGRPMVTTRTTFMAQTGATIDPALTKVVDDVMARASKSRTRTP